MIALLDTMRDRLAERRMRKLSDRFVEWYARDEYDEPLVNLAPRRTRLCWWLSRRLGGRSVFGKADFT